MKKLKQLSLPKLLLLSLGLIWMSCNFNLPKSSSHKFTSKPEKNSGNLYVRGQKFEGVIFGVSIWGGKSFMPTPDEIYEAERIFQNCLKTKQADTNGMITDARSIKATSRYYRQYFGYTLPNGQKIIRLNCFLKEVQKDFRWKIQELSVCDGGNAYFQVNINISTKNCFTFSVNGIA